MTAPLVRPTCAECHRAVEAPPALDGPYCDACGRPLSSEAKAACAFAASRRADHTEACELRL